MDVYIGILTGGQIRAELAAALITMSHDGRYRTEIEFSWDRPIPSNRCRISRKALAWGADHLLMIDADCWPQRNLLDLVERDLDIVAFPCPVWRPGNPDSPVIMNLTPFDGKRTVDLDSEEPFEIKRGGFSAVLIARRVLEVAWNLFAYRFNEDGINVSDEDITFCDVVREKGFRIWTAPQYVCEHIKTIGLLQVNNEFARVRGGI